MTVNLSWNRGDCVVHWNYAEQNVRKEFDLPIQCAVYIANPSSVVIVEDIESSGPGNAVVFDLDGQERVRLRPPGLPALMGFDQVFQSRTEVVAVVVTRLADFHGTPDLITGELRNIREWR